MSNVPYMNLPASHLRGRVAIITGARAGSAWCALALARLGCACVIAAKTVTPHPTPGTIYTVAGEVRAAGAGAMACQVDLRDEKAIGVRGTWWSGSGIDVLINNASACGSDIRTPRGGVDHVDNVRGVPHASAAYRTLARVWARRRCRRRSRQGGRVRRPHRVQRQQDGHDDGRARRHGRGRDADIETRSGGDHHREPRVKELSNGPEGHVAHRQHHRGHHSRDRVRRRRVGDGRVLIDDSYLRGRWGWRTTTLSCAAIRTSGPEVARGRRGEDGSEGFKFVKREVGRLDRDMANDGKTMITASCKI